MCPFQVNVLARESGSHMLDPESDSDDDGEMVMLEPVEFIDEGYMDPEATVTLVFGGSSDWQLLAESLHALVDVLHTAPLGAAAGQEGGALLVPLHAGCVLRAALVAGDRKQRGGRGSGGH
jgi:hypothetical protein